MNNILGPQSQRVMDEEIERLAAKLGTISPLSEDYATILNRLSLLTKARAEKNERAISMDTVLTVVANIAGMLLVLNYEKLNVISTKAITMAWKK